MLWRWPPLSFISYSAVLVKDTRSHTFIMETQCSASWRCWSIFLHSQTHIVIICTQMKLPEPGMCPQVCICHPPLSSWVEFNYLTNFGVCARCWYWPRHFKEGELNISKQAREVRLGKNGVWSWEHGWNVQVSSSQMLPLSSTNCQAVVKSAQGRSRASACPPLTTVKHKEPPHL